LFFWPTIFYCKKTFSLVIVGFVSRFITSALLPTGFHEDNLGRTPTIDLSQITVGIPVEKPFEMDWLLTVAMIYTLGIFAFFDPLWIGLLQ
jgi:hypothetical protein